MHLRLLTAIALLLQSGEGCVRAVVLFLRARAVSVAWICGWACRIWMGSCALWGGLTGRLAWLAGHHMSAEQLHFWRAGSRGCGRL